jgi:hypothetical protein
MKLFLSYCWAQRNEADKLDEFLSHYEVIVIRDVRDLKPLENIKSFMEQIKDADFAILLLSDAYLKSKNCLYEAIKLLDDKGFKNKAVPFLVNGVKLFSPQIRLSYLTHWETQTKELEQAIRQGLNSLTNISNLIKELEHFQLIRSKLDDFFNFITDHLCFNFEEEQSSNFVELVSHLSILKSDSQKKKAVYYSSETITKINIIKGADQIIDIYRLLLNVSNNKNLEIGRLLGHLQEIANSLSNYFKIKTKSTCTVALKILRQEESNEGPSVITLIRDLNSAAQYSELDKIKARIIDNTSYYQITRTITKKRPVFFSNNLVKEIGYTNSSFAWYEKLKNSPFSLNNDQKKGWILPYKSVIVAPIFNKKGDEETTMIGFLSVDSSESDVFDSDEDLKLVSDIGQQLFFALHRFTEHTASL